MNVRTIARGVEVCATALWTGASAGFAVVSAPLAFAIVPDREQFATLTERSLARLATLANVAGGVAIAAAAVGRAPLRGTVGVGALSLLTYHQRSIVPAMSREHVEIGSPEYKALHQQSTRIFGGALLLGVAQLLLAATSTDR
jgi:hypothetical protein